jgi:hypothetical protein
MAAKKPAAKKPEAKKPTPLQKQIAQAGQALKHAQKVTVPMGGYDPNLDAQLRAGQRGLGDLIGLGIDPKTGYYGGQTGKQQGRNLSDLTLGETQGTEDYQTNVDQANRSYQRSLADLLTQRQQNQQDYTTNIDTLKRNYSNLGTNQAGQERKAGAFAGSGAALQATRKRAVNQAIERSPIDTAYQRATDASNLTQGRLGEDLSTTLGNLGTNYARQYGTDGALSLSFNRSNEDLTDAARIAQREQNRFGQDIQTAKVAQYEQLYPGGKLPTTKAPKPQAPRGSIGAGPGIPGTKRKKVGKVVTYTNSVRTP